jgi:hypothetical protein
MLDTCIVACIQFYYLCVHQFFFFFFFFVCVHQYLGQQMRVGILLFLAKRQYQTFLEIIIYQL